VWHLFSIHSPRLDALELLREEVVTVQRDSVAGGALCVQDARWRVMCRGNAALWVKPISGARVRVAALENLTETGLSFGRVLCIFDEFPMFVVPACRVSFVR
jgi:hypothetical protein